MKRQCELPMAEAVFNLRCECGADPDRVVREQADAKRRQAEAEAFAQKCQKSFEQCPGFIGCDAPKGPGLIGRVVVEPGQVAEAMEYLRRRFRVNQNLELDAGRGLCLEVASRPRKVRGARSVRVNFAKPVQFELSL